jgi:hypothetical protein
MMYVGGMAAAYLDCGDDACLYGVGLALYWISDRLERWLLWVFFRQR